jgi:hypothetical protein
MKPLKSSNWEQKSKLRIQVHLNVKEMAMMIELAVKHFKTSVAGIKN